MIDMTKISDRLEHRAHPLLVEMVESMSLPS